MEYSGAGGKLIHEKNQKQKILWHCPFKCGVRSPKLIGAPCAQLWFESTYLTQMREAWEATAPVVRIIEQTRKWSTKLFTVVLSIYIKYMFKLPSHRFKMNTAECKGEISKRNDLIYTRRRFLAIDQRQQIFPRVRTTGVSRRGRETDLPGHEVQRI
jgi:hypothetical protein